MLQREFSELQDYRLVRKVVCLYRLARLLWTMQATTAAMMAMTTSGTTTATMKTHADAPLPRNGGPFVAAGGAVVVLDGTGVVGRTGSTCVEDQIDYVNRHGRVMLFLIRVHKWTTVN